MDLASLKKDRDGVSRAKKELDALRVAAELAKCEHEVALAKAPEELQYEVET